MKLGPQKDCSPISLPPKPGKEIDWLQRLSTRVCAADFVVSVADKRNEDEPIVYCKRDGTWWTGRYVGSLVFEGHSLTIAPRFGMATLREWLFQASSVVLTSSTGQLHEDESFIAQLLAPVWAHGFIQAARHGLPTLRGEVATQGPTIRGRLDVPASLRLIAAGSGQAISIRSERSLAHAASNAIVAAYEVLRRWLAAPDEQWLPARARELLPHLRAVTGARPRVPTKAELGHIHYPPIMAGFAPVAELSRQIASHRGLSIDIDADGETQGILLDVAELWEMYVLHVFRKAATALGELKVTHVTREMSVAGRLLHSDVEDKTLGTLIPDGLIHSGSDIKAVVDAKYKSLYTSGPQREDLYQMAAYLNRFQAQDERTSLGILAYPLDPSKPDEMPEAEKLSPWSLENTKKMAFLLLPHDPKTAIEKAKDALIKHALDEEPVSSKAISQKQN